MEQSKANELKQGIIVFVALAVLTVVEYLVGTSQVPAVIMWIIALLKAGIVIWYFMHVFRVFRSEGGH